ncbi:MAG: phosphoribosylformylglycinamidine synthase subunit PurL, partial [Candidatus Levybacteria bacterium]|nr:phosphoribosylformylglycinamidine synthase subunit PurL [Candidatus Levybacteria bacterium]
DELKAIRAYFQQRGREPTDCEMEIIEARWSEHCVHKTFKAKVIANGVKKAPLFERIVTTAKALLDEEDVSSFVDNSGVIGFYDGLVVCGKVETHNSPSAIEPYGGAMTGSGGVFRDILGTGRGAKVIASTNMHCFAPPDMDLKKLPEGCLPPQYLLQKVIAGVRDYGNPTGVPTNNGSIHFDESFRAKPSVIVGAYGILPEAKAQKGIPQIDDLVVVIGGKTGKDGVHGATYSSREMKGDSVIQYSTAVQIGNPIEEKRTIDAVLECRDNDLIRAITDCGAAGFSSAIGEMGEETGVEVDISHAPLKYLGLAPWEIWLSESQERMVLAVDPSNKERLMEICRKYNVEATVLGQFTDSKRLIVKYGQQVIADLDYNFLIHGLPQQAIKASWQKPVVEEHIPEEPTNWVATLKGVLSDYNVCSREPIVRQYDHGVQGTNVLPPYSGVQHDGPNDAAIITPILGKPYGLVISHGLNPAMMERDPYQGTIWAVAEAMANYVAVGGDPKKAKWINNFIWPSINAQTMGSLDKCVDAVTNCMKVLKNRVVSGKDSLSSTYVGHGGKKIEIQPVLCLSVFGKIPDIDKTITADIKKPGSTLVLVGKLDFGMGGTVYYKSLGCDSSEIPKVDLEKLPSVLEGIHSAISSGQVLACHDVSEGGLLTTISEMCFGGDCGVEITIKPGQERPDMFLFNETAGCFVVEVEDEETAKRLFGNLPHIILGKTTKNKEVRVKVGESELFTVPTDELKQAWQEPLRRFFH